MLPAGWRFDVSKRYGHVYLQRWCPAGPNAVDFRRGWVPAEVTDLPDFFAALNKKAPARDRGQGEEIEP